jgi:hypothetical protein
VVRIAKPPGVFGFELRIFQPFSNTSARGLSSRNLQTTKKQSPTASCMSPPDRHLLVKPSYLRITRGPRENRCRPALDPLFRSAAVAYGERVIGIVLTGMLDDGTAGLIAIKRCQGVGTRRGRISGVAPHRP